MSSVEADLRAYYEEEARLGTRSAVVGRRVKLRDEFIQRITGEGRSSVIDFGAGPGGDAPGFTEAGYTYVGLDLALGNCRRAAAAGNVVIQGSLTHPPFQTHSFDAGWSMSTLMHLPEIEVPDALGAMTKTLRPGAPLLIAVWGADSASAAADLTQSDGIEGCERLFSLRTFERNGELVSGAGSLEEATTWPVGPGGWQYQVFVLRV